MGTNSLNVAARSRRRGAEGPPHRGHRVLLAAAVSLAFVTSIGIEPGSTRLQARQVGPGPSGPSISLATYLGSGLDDGILAVETDASGNLIVFGTVPDAAALPLVATQFFGPNALPDTVDCFVAKLTPDRTLDRFEPVYFARIHDSERCDAMAIAPTGEVYVARKADNTGVVIDRFSDSSGVLQRINSVELFHFASITHLRVDDLGNSYVVGECANESTSDPFATYPDRLWPLPNGFQPDTGNLNPPCKDSSNVGGPGGQYLMVKAGPQGQVFYGSFFGFDTSNIDPTSVEIDALGRVYIAGDIRGQSMFTTFNAFLLQPGDAFCPINTPDCERGDAFLIVFDTRFQGNDSYAYASYLGGTDRESDVAMALAPDGRVHLVGTTQSATTFPGMTFSTPTAIFDLVIDPNQAPADQLVRGGTIVEGHFGASVWSANESAARFRLRPNGTYALLVASEDPSFPFVEPLFDDPRDPNATGEKKARLLVYNPATDDLVLSTYLDDVTLALRPHLASAPTGELYVGMLTMESGRSTSTTEIGGDDVLAFAVDGIGVTVNHPPVANAVGDQTFEASSPAGARVLLYGGLSFDPDNDPLTYIWSEGPDTIGTGSLVEVLLTPGDHSITLTVDDGNGGTDSHTILVRVLPNTPAGGGLTVKPDDGAWANFGIYNRFPVTVQFTNVTATGFTSVTSRAPLPPVPPPGMQFGSPPHVYDVATTTTFTGPLTVCVDYRGMSFARPDADLQIYQQVNGTWMPLPQTNDTSARQICGESTTLGTFAVFSPAVAANEISILAGQPGRSGVCFPPGLPAVQGPDPNEGGFATDSSLCVPRGLAYDAARNSLYFSEGSAADKIRRVDLATGRITTVAGTGFRTQSIDGPGGDPRDDDKNNVDPLTAPIAEALDIALDAAGNLLFAEFGPHGGRIRKVDFAQNLIFTVVDVSAFSLPSTLAIDASGAVLFAGFSDAASHIWRVSPGADGVLNGSPDEAVQVIAGTGANFFDVFAVPDTGANPLQVGTPASGLAFAPDGSLYVTVHLGLPSLLHITPGPDGLVDGNGDTLFHVSGTGTPDPILGDGNPVRNSRMFSPWSVAVGPNGDVYVGDGGHYQASTVRRITAGADGVVTGAPDEIISTVAGFHVFDPNICCSDDLPYSDGDGHALSSIFGAAWGLERLPNGDLLISDSFQVRRVGPRAGGGDSTPPVLMLPNPMVVEAEGANGTVVTFGATAHDDVDGAVAVSCSPQSGSLFGFTGAAPTPTTVTCSATDAAGNTANGTFTVTVQDTTPPVVTVPGPIAVAATEATGARANVPQAPDTALLLNFLAARAATDLADVNPQRLAAQRVDCANPSAAIEPIVAATLFTVGPNCIDVAFTDASGNVGRSVAVLDVAPPIGGHVNDPDTVVTATDMNNVAQPVTASFAAVQQRGLLRAVPTAPPAPPPAGLMFHGVAYDVTTTALAPSAITVCVTESTLGMQQGDRLLLFENGVWLDRTASVDVSASQVCGLPTALGVYAIARQAVALVTVSETIVVRDAPALLPSAIVGVSERIVVQDAPAVLPSAMIGVAERIVVRDVAGVVPPAIVSVVERIVVADTPRLLPSAFVGVNERIVVSDAPRATAIDEIPPVLTLPAAIVAEAQSPDGAVVTFSATATDNLPGQVTVACSPQSGSLFAFNGVGPTTTPVSCTATDAAGNTAAGTFDVVVRDTTAPQVITAQIAVAATEATGARGNVPQAPHTPILQQIPLLAAAIDAGDSSPVRVSVQWVACASPAQVLGPVADTTLYPVGPNCFSYVFRDGSGNVGTGIGTIEVSPPIGGHIDVPNVPVTATDPSNVPLPVTATFLGLDQPGLLTAVPPQFVPPPPAGLVFAGVPFELRSTALAQAPVVVCMRPPAGDVAERLLALEFFQWIDRTEAATPAGEICSRPGELGTFALARRDLSGFTMSMTPLSAVVQAGFGHRVFVEVSDDSDPSTRVMIDSRFEGSVEFRHPQVPNSPLSVTVQHDARGVPSIVTVLLGTGPAGELISTARQVADLITVHAGFGPLFAWVAPNTNGEGIVAPKPLTPLTRLQVSTSSPGVDTSGLDTGCYVSLPALCIADLDPNTLPFAPFPLAITAYLDVNGNQVADPGELSAQGEVTWVDVTAPNVLVPADITTLAASPAGAVVTFTAQAFDAISGELVPSCSPASGSTFAIGATTVTCTATDGSGNVGSRSFTVTVNAPAAPTPTLSLPGNLTVVATDPSGAVVAYTATGSVGAFGVPITFPASCTPASGSTFPIGTTTVNCTATNPLFPPPFSFPATGSFTVTVTVGKPSISFVVGSKGRDASGAFWVDLRLTNTGTGYARSVSIASLTLRTLFGTGTVTFDAARSGPLPLNAGAIEAGGSRVVRVYLDVPATVRRFSIMENGVVENVNGSATLKFSVTQAVIP